MPFFNPGHKILSIIYWRYLFYILVNFIYINISKFNFLFNCDLNLSRLMKMSYL